MDHECIPAKYAEELGNRHVYKELQNIRCDPSNAEKKPARLYLEMLTAPFEAENGESFENLFLSSASITGTLQKEWRTLFGPLFAARDTSPEDSYFEAGTRVFLFPPSLCSSDQVQTRGLTIDIYGRRVNGLHSIVADGNTLHPKPLGRQAQLYCVHGVCSEGVEVPLLYCITSKKTEGIYLKIFDELETNIVGDVPHRIIPDSEKAVVTSARKTFPRESVEGCAFHLAQAWTRKRDHLGLRKHMQGFGKDEPVVQWWSTIKGVVFLPRSLLPQVGALRRSPVPSGVVREKCAEFLSYLCSNRLRGPFKDMWYKWNVQELRITNLAEAFHR
ncbi:hypothetical protein COOONC_27758 [Cooperia oncophora]